MWKFSMRLFISKLLGLWEQNEWFTGSEFSSDFVWFIDGLCVWKSIETYACTRWILDCLVGARSQFFPEVTISLMIWTFLKLQQLIKIIKSSNDEIINF